MMSPHLLFDQVEISGYLPLTVAIVGVNDIEDGEGAWQQVVTEIQ